MGCSTVVTTILPSQRQMPERLTCLAEYPAPFVGIETLERTTKMTGLKGWKTMIFGVVIVGLSALTLTDVVPWVGEVWGPVVFGAVGVLVMALRAVTTTPVGVKA